MNQKHNGRNIRRKGSKHSSDSQKKLKFAQNQLGKKRNDGGETDKREKILLRKETGIKGDRAVPGRRKTEKEEGGKAYLGCFQRIKRRGEQKTWEKVYFYKKKMRTRKAWRERGTTRPSKLSSRQAEATS